MLILYNTVQIFLLLLGLPLWLAAMIRPKRRATFLQRLGWKIATRAQQSAGGELQRPIWIHALSVGEVMSAEPLVDALRRQVPAVPMVFSVSTLTGMQTAQRLYGEKVETLVYFPYDLLLSVQRIAGAVSPRLVVIVETDIWPNFLHYLNRRRIPALWVNARISTATLRGFRLLGPFSRKVLNIFAGVGAQSHLDAHRLHLLGLPPEKVHLTGNVKFDQPVDGSRLPEGPELRQAMGIPTGRRVVIMGSTHPGEEETGLALFLELKRMFHDLLMIIVPRDPGRAGAVLDQARAKGLSGGTLSCLEYSAENDSREVLVVNTIGLLRRLYGLADIAFVGGSLVPQGGHNPLEPAACARPILFGPDMSDFNAVAELLEHGGGAIRVADRHQFRHEMERLLADPLLRDRMGRQALRVFQCNKGAVAKTVALVTQTLERSGGVPRV